MISEFDDLLDDVEENSKYNNYLTEHINNVKNAYQWMKKNIPDMLDEYNYINETAYYGELDDIIDKHDSSKYKRFIDADNYYELTCEYDAYANYFYGERTEDVSNEFDRAWLAHIHANPHHWQHWVISGEKVLDMPYVFIIEMVCDHWSFSWKLKNLYEIFDWYDSHKEKMILSDNTKSNYERILNRIKSVLDNNK